MYESNDNENDDDEVGRNVIRRMSFYDNIYFLASTHCALCGTVESKENQYLFVSLLIYI